MLNHPGESLVLQTDFLYMVECVDICIDFLKNHVRGLFKVYGLLLILNVATLQRISFYISSLLTVHDAGGQS